MDPSVYNGLYTMHGTVMLFLFLFPVLNGFNNLLIPTMIGAPDMAFPKVNAAAFWLVPVFAVVLLSSFLQRAGGMDSPRVWGLIRLCDLLDYGRLRNSAIFWVIGGNKLPGF